MKKAFSSLVAFALFALIFAGCNTGKEQTTQTAPKERKPSITAFKHLNLMPMTEERIIEDQTVLVKGARIIEIGPSSQVTIPESAAIIDGAGAYLMPGLADMHMHTRAN
ncbi:MAG: hypothetical protein JRF35_09965 [Deltaproteobacteria bacterium]|nr:hypothetical protein [Deltaproteobacteria bacterium]